jgi:sterol desaturase/sphingolipid hydroxylase (fatty acid hydroxylase superfamily)
MPRDFWRDLVNVFPAVLTLEAGRYLVAAGLASLALWMLWRVYFRARKLQERGARGADYAREIVTSLRTSLVFAAVGFGTYLAAEAGWLTIYPDFSQRGPAYFAVTLVLMILAQDTWFYWTHRAMHHPRLFRMFHGTHHKSRTPTPWTAYAFDAPEALVLVAFVPLWTALVPMHLYALSAFMTWQIVRNVLGHLGAEWAPVSGRTSRLWGWLTTTTHHDLHHEDARWNYGLYFTWWDRLMGTEHPQYQKRVAAVAARAKAGCARCATKAALVLLTLGVAAATFPDRANAQAPSGIEGRWATQGFNSVVEIGPCNGALETLCGRIVWLREPLDVRGRPRTDEHNPDNKLRVRPLVGIEIVRGLHETSPGVWSGGSLYNPDDGRTYTGTMRLRDGALALTGCALRVLCRSQTWRRPEDVPAMDGARR